MFIDDSRELPPPNLDTLRIDEHGEELLCPPSPDLQFPPEPSPGGSPPPLPPDFASHDAVLTHMASKLERLEKHTWPPPPNLEDGPGEVYGPASGQPHMCPPSPDLLFSKVDLSATGEVYRSIMNIDRSPLSNAEVRALEAAAKVYKRIIVPLRYNVDKVQEELMKYGRHNYEILLAMPSPDLEITSSIMSSPEAFEAHASVLELFFTNLMRAARYLDVDAELLTNLQHCADQWWWLLDQYRQGRIICDARRRECFV